mmetsp:Transcript_15977/g.23522  ORF Transcript_15977/g.23522 Transcript_15977/m.23522 type:complete len:231 (-) Transcript_15977:546-1238(-)
MRSIGCPSSGVRPSSCSERLSRVDFDVFRRYLTKNTNTLHSKSMPTAMPIQMKSDTLLGVAISFSMISSVDVTLGDCTTATSPRAGPSCVLIALAVNLPAIASALLLLEAFTLTSMRILFVNLLGLVEISSILSKDTSSGATPAAAATASLNLVCFSLENSAIDIGIITTILIRWVALVVGARQSVTKTLPERDVDPDGHEVQSAGPVDGLNLPFIQATHGTAMPSVNPL